MADLGVRTDLHVEEVGDRLLVLDPASSHVFELRGGAAEAFRLVRDGADVPEGLAAELAALVAAGLVETDGWDRRRVLLAGGAAAAATLLAVALPSPVAAQSAPGGGGPGGGGPTGPTVPAPPTLQRADVLTGGGTDTTVQLTFAYGSDGGSPIVGYRVYVDGAPFVTRQVFVTGPIVTSQTASIQVSALNALGESALSNTLTPLGGP